MLLSIYLSYALQFYVPFEIIQPIVRNYVATTTFDYRGIGDVVLRIVLVVLTCNFNTRLLTSTTYKIPSSCYSCHRCSGTEFGSDPFACWLDKLINTSSDTTTNNSCYNLLARSTWSFQMDVMDGCSYFAIWNMWFSNRNLC